MRIKTAVAASLLTLSLMTACSSESPSESTSPTLEPTVTGSPSSEVSSTPEPAPPVQEVFEVVIPQDVTDAHPDNVGTLAERGNALIALTQSGIEGLQGERTGDELSYYEPLKEVMTPRAWEEITQAVPSEDPQVNVRAVNFVPQADRDGYFTLVTNEERYLAVEPGITSEAISPATVKFANAGASWTQKVKITAHAEGATISYEREVSLLLAPSEDGSWLITDWVGGGALDGINVEKF